MTGNRKSGIKTHQTIVKIHSIELDLAFVLPFDLFALIF